MRRLIVSLVLLTLLAAGGQQFGVDLAPRPANAIEIETVVWQFGQDYPGVEGDDTLLPVGTVHVKTHDGTDWMSTYDGNSKAVTGPASLRRLIADYNAKGIEVVAWFVPKGVDVEDQVRMAEDVLDTGVKALYAGGQRQLWAWYTIHANGHGRTRAPGSGWRQRMRRCLCATGKCTRTRESGLTRTAV